MTDKSVPAKGFAQGLTNYGDRAFSLYMRRSFASSMGYSEGRSGKARGGHCGHASGFNNCHRHFPELLEAVKRGVLMEGALPVEFPTVSLGRCFSIPRASSFET